MENYEESSGDQMDLPYEDDEMIAEGPADVSEPKKDFESAEDLLAGPRSDNEDGFVEAYLNSRTDEERLEDNCPICGGSGPCYRCQRN